MMTLENLFKPISLGRVNLRNRIAMAPMGMGIEYEGEVVPDSLLPYLKARSRGGVGLIISEGFRATRHQNVSFYSAHEDRFLPSLKKYVESIQGSGTPIFCQIMSLGGKDIDETYAPSSIDSPLYISRPKEYSTDQIKEIIEDFIESAHRAQKAGFDGVELHGGHSYMIGQFISPHFNRRTDEYGSDFEGRMKVPTEIVKGIKNICGSEFPVGFKFSAWEQLPNGVNHELAVKIAQRMEDEGVIYLHVQTSDFYPPASIPSKYPAMPPLYSPRNTLAELSENLKKHVKGVPIICAAGIIDPGESDRLIRDGKADMVAVGRALLADPEWPNKAREGKRIRPCIRCNICHHKVVVVEEPIACTVNPYLCHEKEEPLKMSESPKDVMVVGSGPAGLTCALSASNRGHNVRLYEKRDEMGGLLIPGTTPPFKKDVRALLGYLLAEVDESRIQIILDTTVTSDLVKKIQPDVLVVAVGANPIPLNVPCINGENVISAVEALKDSNQVKGEKIVVVGGGEVGCETALYLSQKGKDVTIVETLDDILLIDVVQNNTTVLRELLKKNKIQIHVGMKVQKITSGSIIMLSKNGLRKELESEVIVTAIGLESDKKYVRSLLDSCDNSFSIGDCVKPARLLEAIHEGDKIGRTI